jgi:hypothetical protein
LIAVFGKKSCGEVFLKPGKFFAAPEGELGKKRMIRVSNSLPTARNNSAGDHRPGISLELPCRHGHSRSSGSTIEQEHLF